MILVLLLAIVLGLGAGWLYVETQRCKYWHIGFIDAIKNKPDGCPVWINKFLNEGDFEEEDTIKPF